MTTLDFEPLTVTVPLREEPAGVLRVGKSRVLLELVLHAFKAGTTPEAIVQSCVKTGHELWIFVTRTWC
jgi:hypothetical protein